MSGQKHKSFSIKEAINFGWNIAKKNIWFFVALLIIPQIVSSIFSGIADRYVNYPNTKLIGFLINLAGWIIGMEFSYATYAIFFKFADKKKAGIKELFSYFDAKLIFRFILVSVLYSIIVGFGLIFFIIPGIYFAIKYLFALYIFVDKRTGVIESFKESSKITEGIKWKLFKLGLVQIGIIVCGALAFFVGLFVAIPVNYLADIYIYRKLTSKE